MSLPSRGAWIEINQPFLYFFTYRRSLHGERGLKYLFDEDKSEIREVAPFTGSVD